jgi:hypothetical protein
MLILQEIDWNARRACGCPETKDFIDIRQKFNVLALFFIKVPKKRRRYQNYSLITYLYYINNQRSFVSNIVII